MTGIDFHAIGKLFGLSAEVLMLLLFTSETFMTLPFFSENIKKMFCPQTVVSLLLKGKENAYSVTMPHVKKLEQLAL